MREGIFVHVCKEHNNTVKICKKSEKRVKQKGNGFKFLNMACISP